MKRQVLKMMALVAMMMASTAMSAQTETYSFREWAPNKSGNTFVSAPAEEAVTSTSGKEVYVETALFEGNDLNGRFAWESGLKPTANQGLALAGKRKTAAILNLKEGDKVTITHGGTNIYVRTANVSYTTDGGDEVTLDGLDVAESEEFLLVSEREYTMTADGSLDFYIAGSGTVRFQTVVIEPNNGETTGIVTLDHSTISPSDYCYDLQGRRVPNGKWSNGQMRKGVYIINGKKTVIR